MTIAPITTSTRMGTTPGTLCAGDDLRLANSDGWLNGTLSTLTMVSGTATPSGTGTGLIYETYSSAVAAYVSGGQASATPLTSTISRVTTGAAIGASVMLPASAPGLDILVINSAANSITVFGSGSDTLNGLASGVGVSQMISSMVLYACTTLGAWFTEGIGTGFNGGLPTVSFTEGITAVSGASGLAVPLTTVLNRVTTCGTSGYGVKLPIAGPGLEITVVNAGAQTLAIYPASGDQINALGASSGAYGVIATKTATFFSTVTGQWHTLLSS